MSPQHTPPTPQSALMETFAGPTPPSGKGGSTEGNSASMPLAKRAAVQLNYVSPLLAVGFEGHRLSIPCQSRNSSSCRCWNSLANSGSSSLRSSDPGPARSASRSKCTRDSSWTSPIGPMLMDSFATDRDEFYKLLLSCHGCLAQELKAGPNCSKPHLCVGRGSHASNCVRHHQYPMRRERYRQSPAASRPSTAAANTGQITFNSFAAIPHAPANVGGQVIVPEDRRRAYSRSIGTGGRIDRGQPNTRCGAIVLWNSLVIARAGSSIEHLQSRKSPGPFAGSAVVA